MINPNNILGSSNLSNPYDNYRNLSNKPVQFNSNLSPPNNNLMNSQIPVFPDPSMKNPVVLSETILPRSYYDDVIDHLELISLNIVNDIKTLIKNQKKLRVSKLDTKFLDNIRDSISEQFYDVENYRTTQKDKILKRFNESKNVIEDFMNKKFQPIDKVLDKFSEELGKNKGEMNKKLDNISKALSDQNDKVKKLLLNQQNKYVKNAAEMVYYPNDKSELQFAQELYRKYISKEQEMPKEKPKTKPKLPPIEIIEPEKDKEEVQVEQEEENEDKPEEEEEKPEEEEEEEKDDIPPKYIKKFRAYSLAVKAAFKLSIIRRKKLYYRVIQFKQNLFAIDDFLEELINFLLFKTFDDISKYKEKIDLNIKTQKDKLDDFFRYITDDLLIKTTQVKINRTFTFFFKRYIYQEDVVPPKFFSLFERRRIRYIPEGYLNKQSQEFVLMMKIVVNTLVYKTLIGKARKYNNTILGDNYLLIASIIYYSVIKEYYEQFPLLDTEFNSDDYSFFKFVDVYKPTDYIQPAFNAENNSLNQVRQRELNELIKKKNENYKNISTYKDDRDPNKVMEVERFLLPYGQVESYFSSPASEELINNLRKWIGKIMDLMEQHNFAFRD